MSLTNEIAHELRPVLSPNAGSIVVLPSWAKVIPVLFYVGFAFFLLALTGNTFQQNLQNAKRKELQRVVGQYEEMTRLDKQTVRRLIDRRNAAVKIARWVEYSPMIQPILMGIFSGLDERAQISTLTLDRRDGVTPEFALGLAFAAQQGDVDSLISNVRARMLKYNWQVITQSQIHQDGIANIQSYVQPTPAAARFESLYLPILPQPNASETSAVSGVAQ